MRKFLFLSFLVLLIVGTVFFITLYRTGVQKLPEGTEGPEASELANKIEKAVGLEKYKQGAAIEFVFNTTGVRHYRDLKLSLIEVQFQESSNEYNVQYSPVLDLFRVKENGETITGEKAKRLYETAKIYHSHDYFWMNPFLHLHDEKTLLKKIGERALLVTFLQANGEDGDSYMIVTDSNYRPTHWKMWASHIPLKGIEVSFDHWVKTDNGAWLSLSHDTFLQKIEMELIGYYTQYPKGSSPDERFGELLSGKGMRISDQ